MHRLFVKADKLSYEVIGAAMRNDKGLNGDLDRLPMLTWIMFLKFLDDLNLTHRFNGGLRYEPKSYQSRRDG